MTVDVEDKMCTDPPTMFMPPVITVMQPALDRHVPGLYPSSHEIVHDDVVSADDLDLLTDELHAITESLVLLVKSHPHLAQTVLSSMQLVRKFIMKRSNGDYTTELREVVVNGRTCLVEEAIIETPTVSMPKAKEAHKMSRVENEYDEARNSSRNTLSSHNKNKSKESSSTKKSKKRKTKD